MRKKVMRYGGSLVIVFNKSDIEAYGIREGDVIDIDDMLLQKQPKHKKSK